MSTKLLDFKASWCGPCRIMDPIIEEIKKELGDKMELVEIDVDSDKDGTSQKYGVMSIPTYIILKDDKEMGRKVGVTKKEDLLNLITQN